MHKYLTFILLFSLLFAWPGCSVTSHRGPAQALKGPGSSDYTHNEISYKRYREKQFQYFIFLPQKPAPKIAPVIALLHGWGSMSPYAYGGWIEHLVRRGNIVVYPRMQSSIATDNGGITYTAIDSIKDALLELDKGEVKPDRLRFAVMGHSAGGNAAINIAALAKRNGLPKIKAVMCAQPGLQYSKGGTKWTVLEDLSPVPPDTLLLITLGDKDTFVRETDARKIWDRTTNVKPENKGYVMLISDDYGKPVLKASHPLGKALNRRFDLPTGIGRTELKEEGTITPLTPLPYPTKRVNALDYYGLWKLFDGLYEAAFYGRNRKYALGNTKEQRYMGVWEDGTPVKEIKVLDGPTPVEPAGSGFGVQGSGTIPR